MMMVYILIGIVIAFAVFSLFGSGKEKSLSKRRSNSSTSNALRRASISLRSANSNRNVPQTNFLAAVHRDIRLAADVSEDLIKLKRERFDVESRLRKSKNDLRKMLEEIESYPDRYPEEFKSHIRRWVEDDYEISDKKSGDETFAGLPSQELWFGEETLRRPQNATTPEGRIDKSANLLAWMRLLKLIDEVEKRFKKNPELRVEFVNFLTEKNGSVALDIFNRRISGRLSRPE